MKNISILTLIAVLFLSGCAKLNSIHRTTNTSQDSTMIAVDAKQRFAIIKNKASSMKICLEPSPDVFSAISSAFQGSISKSNALATAFQAAMSESAGTIGIRTESIQLLRDAMYRLCEGHINGAIEADEFYLLHDRYQKSMVTLVAIGALADTARPVQLSLGGSASITRNELISTLKEKLKNAESKLKSAESELEKASKTARESIVKMCEEVVKETESAEESLCKDKGKTDEDEMIVATYCELAANKETARCTEHSKKIKVRNEAQAAKKQAENNVKNVHRDLKDAESNPDIKTSSIVSWANPSTTQTSPESIAAIAEVVSNLVTTLIPI